MGASAWCRLRCICAESWAIVRQRLALILVIASVLSGVLGLVLFSGGLGKGWALSFSKQCSSEAFRGDSDCERVARQVKAGFLLMSVGVIGFGVLFIRWVVRSRASRSEGWRE